MTKEEKQSMEKLEKGIVVTEGARTRLIIQLTEYKGKGYLSIRKEWTKDSIEPKEWFPKTAINLDFDTFETFLGKLNKFDELINNWLEEKWS